jgi:D-arabinose 1-dehydrogenase-like Zn-dependent alcohol dehydrogenase
VQAAKSFDLILDTVSANHELLPYVATLKNDGIQSLDRSLIEP